MVIEGSADGPVWLDIRDDDVQLQNARALWGKDTWETQQQIWNEVGKDKRYGGWKNPSDEQNQFTQRPAVIAIGQAGEHLCRVASLVHDAGHGSGQGGFGAVWGSKKLKAMSVIGTGNINIASPKALIEARLWAKKSYSFNIDDPEHVKELNSSTFNLGFGAPALPGSLWHRPKESRPHACIGCHSSCRSRHGTGLGNESTCATSLMYAPLDLRRHSGKVTKAIFSLLDRFGQVGAAFGLALVIGKQSPAAYIASDLTQKYGINSVELMLGIQYLRDLYKKAIQTGIEHDPRGSKAALKDLDLKKRDFEDLKPDEKAFFDTESLTNPYADFLSGKDCNVPVTRSNGETVSVPGIKGIYQNGTLIFNIKKCGTASVLLDKFIRKDYCVTLIPVDKNGNEMNDRAVSNCAKTNSIMDMIIGDLIQQELGMQVVERCVDRTELFLADEVFLAGTGVQIAAITRIDFRPIGSGHMGQLTARLRELYFNVVRGKIGKYRHWCLPVYSSAEQPEEQERSQQHAPTY